jgi:hypothetical protein
VGAICAQALAGDTVTYAYDALGRLVAANADDRGATYRYDAAENLTAITANNSPMAITGLQPGTGVAGTALTVSLPPPAFPPPPAGTAVISFQDGSVKSSAHGAISRRRQHKTRHKSRR